MSGTPPHHLQRPPRHEGLSSQWVSHSQSHQPDDKLQIRVVPYSPPRISSDEPTPTTSRPVSFADDAEGSASQPHSSSPIKTPTRPNVEVEQGYFQDSDQEPWPKSGVSDLPGSVQSSSPNLSVHADSLSVESDLPSPRALSSTRPKRVISINSDKTFSLVPQSDTSRSSLAGSFGSAQLSSTTPSSSWGRVSSNVFLVEDRSSSPLTPQAERRFSFGSPASASPVTALPTPSHPPPTSPRHARMRGGLRKVDRTPDSKGKLPASVPSSPEDVLPPLPEDMGREGSQSHQLAQKGSFQASESDSTLSDRTNYKIYGESSPVAPSRRETTVDLEGSIPPSSSHSNYQILGESSSSSNQSFSDLPRPPTNDSDANYVVYGGPSASCSTLASHRSPTRPEYSQESLVVAPLRPVKHRSFDRSNNLRSQSRESLRRGSLSSLGSNISQDATRALFAGPSTTPIQGPPRAQNPWEAGSSSAPYQHYWSAPLSTVMSESEGGSFPPSRSLSPFSSADRRSSGFHSLHSRNLLSMSSSLAGLDEQMAVPTSPERPPTTLNRTISRDQYNQLRLIRDHDEDGDGLADLEELRPTRTRLASFVSNNSDQILRSSGSNRSINPFSLPAWTRLYYCSEPRRFLINQASSESMRSLYNGSMYNDGPFSSNFLHRTPSAERFTSNVYNPRRRPHEIEAGAGSGAGTGVETAEAFDRVEDLQPPPSAAPSRVRSIARGVKKQTSSIWSPHLRRDHRESRYSMWDPPSAVWSTQSGFDWRRNQQVVLFVIGFMIPFGTSGLHLKHVGLIWVTDVY